MILRNALRNKHTFDRIFLILRSRDAPDGFSRVRQAVEMTG
jgi:hypothetical protein